MTIVDDWKRNFLIKILISVAENKAINFNVLGSLFAVIM